MTYMQVLECIRHNEEVLGREKAIDTEKGREEETEGKKGRGRGRGEGEGTGEGGRE